MSRENRLWGAERIRDTIALMGFPQLDVETVRKYMVSGGTCGQRSSTWLSFLRNDLQVSWAMDFFAVTIVGFGRLYVFTVLEHGRRWVVHWAITDRPTMSRVIQQLRETTPFGLRPQYQFRDNDRIYGKGAAGFLKSCENEEVRTAYGRPWQNPFVERLGGSLRRELLDHMTLLFLEEGLLTLVSPQLPSYKHKRYELLDYLSSDHLRIRRHALDCDWARLVRHLERANPQRRDHHAGRQQPAQRAHLAGVRRSDARQHFHQPAVC